MTLVMMRKALLTTLIMISLAALAVPAAAETLGTVSLRYVQPGAVHDASGEKETEEREQADGDQGYAGCMLKDEHDEIELAGLRFQIGVLEEALAAKPSDTDALRFLAHAYGSVGRDEDRLTADQRLSELLPRDPRSFYNLACSLALLQRTDEALDALAHAFSLGFHDGVLIRKDHDLDTLREVPRFVELMALLPDS